jgi:hypothetical protein
LLLITITSGAEPTSAAVSSLIRSVSVLDHRTSIRTLRPSLQPSLRSVSRNAAVRA